MDHAFEIAGGRPLHLRHHSEAGGSRPVAVWLFLCCFVLFVLIVVGGVTRLTHSGLSITEWQPLIGTLPPLTDAQWAETFAKYQQTPEYKKINAGMSLEAFKGIFWWEYVHRLLARSLGAVFLLPLLWFVVRGQLRGALAWKLGAVFLLGGAQGAMGWYMVQSGLVDDPRVSHLRLTAHLGLAFAIFAAMYWIGLSQWRGTARSRAGDGLGAASVAIALLAFVQVLSGGMVAGIRAGFAYNTFPLMADALVPAGILMLDPWYMNAVYNVATIQFIHRMLAWLVLFAVGWLWWRTRASRLEHHARLAIALLLWATALQFALGVATLVLMVPMPLAAAHQGGAVVLLAAALNAAHALR